MAFINSNNIKKFAGGTSLTRVDLNVETQEEKNAFRIDAILPTINFLLKHKVKIVLLSHRGRPKRFDRGLSLKSFVPILKKKIRKPVVFINHFNFSKVRKQIRAAKQQVFLLENLRFLRGEDKNSRELGKVLASLGDFYVNDAFAVSHRQNASVAAITKFLPSFGGKLLKKEIDNLRRIKSKYKRPFVIILGGAKTSDKLGVIKYFWQKADRFLLGGGPANTFLLARGAEIGDSLYDENIFPFVGKIVDSPKIILPIDLRRQGNRILDIGYATMRRYEEIIGSARTIIWNGPIGLFEDKNFEDGTRSVWKAIVRNKKAFTVVGGGETTASLRLLGKHPRLPKNIFISTGGGAMLAYLAGEKLPGLEALKSRR